jgi:hypothetical protein
MKVLRTGTLLLASSYKHSSLTSSYHWTGSVNKHRNPVFSAQVIPLVLAEKADALSN